MKRDYWLLACGSGSWCVIGDGTRTKNVTVPRVVTTMTSWCDVVSSKTFTRYVSDIMHLGICHRLVMPWYKINNTFPWRSYLQTLSAVKSKKSVTAGLNGCSYAFLAFHGSCVMTYLKQCFSETFFSMNRIIWLYRSQTLCWHFLLYLPWCVSGSVALTMHPPSICE